LPGSDATPDNLVAAYTYLLAQFERRRAVELGQLLAPAMPSTTARRRRSTPEHNLDTSEAEATSPAEDSADAAVA
jgi:WhiB family redox-sensing transcriptional regulator